MGGGGGGVTRPLHSRARAAAAAFRRHGRIVAGAVRAARLVCAGVTVPGAVDARRSTGQSTRPGRPAGRVG
jgi:hypothetical protein